MATVKNVVKDVPAMLSNFRASLPEEYATLLPDVTDNQSLQDFANVMFQYQPIMNAMYSYLINKIAFTKIGKMYFTNPLQHAKRGNMPLGFTIEDIWVDTAIAHEYNPSAVTTDEAASVLKTEMPNILSVFHNVNRMEFYKKTVYYQLLRQSFTTFEGVSNLVDSIINTLYSSNDVAEYTYTTAIFGNWADLGAFYQVQVDPVTDKESAEDFLVAVREVSSMFHFPSRKYNPMGVMNTSSFGNQILYITPQADAQLSVKALAYAFHMDEADFTGRTVMIDQIPNHPEIIAVMADEAFLNIYDQLFEATSAYNAEKLYTNYFLHVHQAYFGSPWHNAVAFVTSTPPTVTSVTVTPTPTSYTPGSTVQLVATVTGTNTPSQSCIFRVSGNTSKGTQIMGTTLITGIDEEGSLVVTATSIADNQKSGSVTINKNSGQPVTPGT